MEQFVDVVEREQVRCFSDILVLLSFRLKSLDPFERVSLKSVCGQWNIPPADHIQVVFPVEVKDPGAPVDFYINGKKASLKVWIVQIILGMKVSKNDDRCEYVNLGEGKHQLIIHKVGRRE